jgi:hypothetical protein
MNIAGALGYLLREASPIDPDTLAGALDAVADEPVDPDVLSAVVPIAERNFALFRPVRYDELRATGRTGLISLNREVLARALADSPDAPPRGDRSWAKAVEVGDDALIYPQDQRPDVRLVLWAPVAVGPDEVRLTPLDLGINLHARTSEPPAVLPQPCAIVFTGNGASLRKTCAPGSCHSACAQDWKIRGEKRWLFGCSCPQG